MNESKPYLAALGIALAVALLVFVVWKIRAHRGGSGILGGGRPRSGTRLQ